MLKKILFCLLILTTYTTAVSGQTSVNNAPYTPRNPSPLNGSSGDEPILFSWQGDDPDGDSVTYKVEFGPSLSNMSSFDTDGTSWSVTGQNLQKGFTYYWRITASDGILDTKGPMWSFTVAGNTPHPDGTISFSPDPLFAKNGEKYFVMLKLSQPAAESTEIELSSDSGDIKLTPSTVTVGQNDDTVYFEIEAIEDISSDITVSAVGGADTPYYNDGESFTMTVQPKTEGEWVDGVIQIASCATFDLSTATLHLPCVDVLGQSSWVDLKLEDPASLTLRFIDMGTSTIVGGNCTSLDLISSTIHVPCLDVGVSYGFDLVLTNSDPVMFQLKNLTVHPKELLSIDVTPSGDSIERGSFQYYEATGHYSDGSTKDLTHEAVWESSNPDIGNMTERQGLIACEAVGVGESVITASLGAISGSTTLTVHPVELVSIDVTASGDSIGRGSFQYYEATGSYSDGSTKNVTNEVVWESSNPDVGNITEHLGLIACEAVGVGESVITASLGSISGSTTLTVRSDFTKRFGRSTSLINNYYQPGSNFSLSIVNASGITFSIEKAELRNGDAVIGSTTDPSILNGGVLAPDESVSIAFTLSNATYDDGISIVFYLTDSTTDESVEVLHDFNNESTWPWW